MFMVLAFTPTANAQQPLGVSSCSATPVVPLVRAEGVAEAAGDIDILCTNTPGVSVNVVQYLPTNLNVLANNTNFTNSIGLVAGGVADLTEAVVIINSNHSMIPSATSDVPPTGGDEPDSRFPGPQYMELTGATTLTANEMQFPVPGAPNDGEWEPGDDLDDCIPGFGDTGGSACFPTTTTIKIGNIRVNASALAAPSQVSVTVSMTGETNIPIFPNVLNIALPLVGLAWGVTSGGVGLQCADGSLHATVSLNEGFATSFKTLGVPTFIPGNTQVESGYYSPGGGATQGTRFKIWFLNVPDGVDVSVDVSHNNAFDDPLTADVVEGDDASNDCSDPVNLDGDGICMLLITGTDANGAGGIGATYAVDPVAVTIDSDGMGMVVYEVTDGNPFATESCDIGVWYSWEADTDADEPTPSTTQIRVNFAPVATSFVADGVSPRPRFIDTGDSPEDAASIRRCTTTLLYPWISNQAGFDTGVVVSNTSADWLSTPHQAGSCTVHWHGADANGPLDASDDTTSAVINAGEQFVFLVSNEAPGFQGYIIILCDFQFAHGFAYLSDGFAGVPTQAQGYLALILAHYDDAGVREAPEALSQ